MKKFILSAFLFGAISYSAAAQGTYLRIGSGYAFPTATGSYYEYSGNSSSETIKLKNYSFGKGINNQIAFGFMLNEHIGFEIGAGYLKGLKTEFKEDDFNGSTTQVFTSEHRANMIGIMPSLVFKGRADGISPFARVGMVAGSVKGISNYNSFDGFDKSEAEVKETGGVTLGLSAALGVTFPISDRISFYAEGNLLQMSWAPKKGELTKATENGADILGTLTKDEKEWDYVDEVTYNFSGGGSPNNDQLAEKRPMNNAGISIGLQFNF